MLKPPLNPMTGRPWAVGDAAWHEGMAVIVTEVLDPHGDLRARDIGGHENERFAHPGELLPLPSRVGLVTRDQLLEVYQMVPVPGSPGMLRQQHLHLTPAQAAHLAARLLTYAATGALPEA